MLMSAWSKSHQFASLSQDSRHGCNEHGHAEAGYCSAAHNYKHEGLTRASPGGRRLLAGVAPKGVRPQWTLPSGVGNVVRTAPGPKVEGMGVLSAGLDTWGIPRSSRALSMHNIVALASTASNVVCVAGCQLSSQKEWCDDQNVQILEDLGARIPTKEQEYM